jgi:hypothetical protein
MKRIILSLITTMMLAILPAATVLGNAYADCGNASTSKTQVLNGIGETGGNCDDSGVTNAIHAVVNILSIVVGVFAVIVVILAGFKYIASGGDSSKVGNAKNTLIYALIGLVVAALAQLLVHFVINQSTGAACPPGSTDSACQPGH